MKNFFYRVAENDGVLSLAKRFGVSPAAIVKDNALSKEISAGDVLFIRKTEGELYTVKPFDTLEEVAARFGVSPEKLAEYNGVEYLFYGLTIVIPE
ncbi:MAG: LysM peptidoglycan-binding domain-containing protein [Clostridia bacterium]|nr:LysM peptidoglycan-binding domain-containing protein [Clostridia bacterium]